MSQAAGAMFFTVVMATYGRGRHILPSINSVLRQDMRDFELLVVGDATTDETESVVASVADPRVRWLNLPKRCGSQSGPNNAGIEAARGEVIAYLGHDDVWAQDHLSRLAALYRSEDPPDFAMSGVIRHSPPGAHCDEVMGLFPDGTDIRRYFFPPSAFSHRRSVSDRIGPWRMQTDIRPPADQELLQRAAEVGMRFRSTGAVTVHKFPAAQRYLSYVRHDSGEQEAALARMAKPDYPEWVAAILADAKANGRFMVPHRKDFSGLAKGELALRTAARRGSGPIDVAPLGRGAVVRHKTGVGGFDWRVRPRFGFRITHATARPRLLVPLVGGRTALRFVAVCQDATALGPIRLDCNGVPAIAQPGRRWPGLVAWFASYRAEITLHPDAPSLLELHLSEAQVPKPGRRLGIGPLHLRPL
jgi:hypothetical protein